MNIKEYLKLNRESSWKLGIAEHGYEDILKHNIHWLDDSKYPNKWFSDPFIYDYNDSTIWLFVEEYDYKFNKGRIARLTVDRNLWRIVECKILLDLPTHLSFPVINRIDGKIYVTPENNLSGEFDLYIYNEEKEKLEKVKTLVNKRLTDAVPFELNGRWYLTTTEEPHPNGGLLDIYISNSLMGPFTKVQSVQFKENISRNAGQPFLYKDRLMRAAQESNYSYGHNLSFQEISVDTNGNLAFKEVNRIYQRSGRFIYGTHTYNEYKGMGVTDVKGDRNFLIGRFYYLVHEMLVKLHIKNPILLK